MGTELGIQTRAKILQKPNNHYSDPHPSKDFRHNIVHEHCQTVHKSLAETHSV
jgi:hypothetical protein